MTRPLGARSGIDVSALGFGCWAIGGPFGPPGQSSGWGEVDDAESVAALRRGLELGVNFFDTADVYGTGHSEKLLGSLVASDRDRVAIATKFGNTFDEGTGLTTGQDVSPAYIRRACTASLRRLGTDRIDLYQCHVGELERGVAEEVVAALEELRAEGLIRGYGVSVDTTEHVEGWVARRGNVSVQHRLNVLEDAPEMLALCERHGLASLNRSPLAMGLLSGKFSEGVRLPEDDVRASGAGWLTAFEADGRPNAEWLRALEAIRECLTEGGRTLVQGALAWIWARSPVTIPIPGFKTVAQAEENAGALSYGPLSDERMREIDDLLGRRTEGRATGAGNTMAMSREAAILSALTSEPTSTEALYERVGYATLARLGLIPYATFRAELAMLAADGQAESSTAADGATMWRTPTPPDP